MVTVADVLADRYDESPAKLAVTGTDPATWLTEAMEQSAAPAWVVVEVQVWAVLPEPRVRTTDRPLSGVPAEGTFVVNWADRANEPPDTATVAPV
jgi:hypothetical protein